MLFIANNIHDVVDWSRMMPAGDGQKAAKKTWLSDNARAKFLISSAMEYEQLQPLLMCFTAK